MAVKIGHASIDENGGTHGGRAGDQTGKEVCVRGWYSKPWKMVLRPKDRRIADKSAGVCEACCANPHVGYDQYQRYTLYNALRALDWDAARLTSDVECDCSSLVCACLIAAGVDIPHTLRTATMEKAIIASGKYTKLTDKKYINGSEYLRRGDILLKPSGHTALVLTNGAKAEDDGILRRGDCGEDVLRMQQALIRHGCALPKYGADGEFGSETEAALREFQGRNGLPESGELDAETRAALDARTYVITIRALTLTQARELAQEWNAEYCEEE